MGDKITVQGSGNTVVNRSIINSALSRVKEEFGNEVAESLLRVEEEINKSGNRAAAEHFEALGAELQKTNPSTTVLKSLWQGILAVLPVIKELPGVLEGISSLFG